MIDTPPLDFRSASSHRRMLRRALDFLTVGSKAKAEKPGPRTIDAFDAEMGLPQLQYLVGESPVVLVPKDMLVMQGAHFYSHPSHPFNIAAIQGHDALQLFYHHFSPTNLLEMYRLEPRGLPGEQLAPWELPWLMRKRKHPSGEGGLSAEHGVSFFGPCTADKVALEIRRMTTTIESIRSRGYHPERHGHIEGYFLKREQSYKFFVMGGKHRAASLCHLGYKSIPIRIRADCPRVIDRRDAENWPMVRNAEIHLELARSIFDRHFD